jgi:hypothetical protein
VTAIRPERPFGARAYRTRHLFAKLSGFSEEVIEAPHQGGDAVVWGPFVGHAPEIYANIEPLAFGLKRTARDGCPGGAAPAR